MFLASMALITGSHWSYQHRHR